MEVVRLSSSSLDPNGSAPALVATPASAAGPDALDPRAELPRPRRPTGSALAVLGAVAGVGALVLGSWAFVWEARSDRGTAAAAGSSTEPLGPSISLLSRPSTQRLPLAGSNGRIVLAVGAGGRAVLVLDGLDPAAPGESYQAWLIGPNRKVVGSAGVFTGTEAVVRLTRLIPPRSGIGVTLERRGGVPVPTRRLILVARRQ